MLDELECLTSGLLFVNNQNAYIGINNVAYKLLTEEIDYTCRYNVTLVDNRGAAVSNQQVTCTTNSHQYNTDGSGKIHETIYSMETSLTFTWSTSTTNGWTQVSGVLEQYQTTTSNYTATVRGTPAGTVNVTGRATVNQSISGDQYRITASNNNGTSFNIGNKTFTVVHTQLSNSSIWVVLRYWEEDCVFDSGGETYYFDAEIQTKLQDWFEENIPQVWREHAISSRYIPSRDQVFLDWAWFKLNNDSNRIFYDSRGTAHEWWTRTDASTREVVTVTTIGDQDSMRATGSCGFRPALQISASLFNVS